MKRSVRRASDMTRLEISKITPRGETVLSRLRVERDQDGNAIEIKMTADAADVIRQIKWLEVEVNVFYATHSLMKVRETMLEALQDLLSAVL
jgi:hypothetical protein